MFLLTKRWTRNPLSCKQLISRRLNYLKALVLRKVYFMCIKFIFKVPHASGELAGKK
jgi:hypothetical protein